MIYQGDSLSVLKTLESESINCCITSPPYWGLRDYGVEGQLGLEKTPEEYVIKMVEVFREVKRVLKREGTLWLNLGDSYIGSWGNYGGQHRGVGRQRQIINGSQIENPAYFGKEKWRPPTTDAPGLKPKDLCGIPWRVAFALQKDGWYLRQDIIWAKPNPMPESVTDRCTKAHEYIFLLAKSQKYYFDNEAIKEPCSEISKRQAEYGWNCDRPSTKNASMGRDGIHTGKMGNRFVPEDGRNKRSVWTVTTKPFKDAHFATFPEDLILPCVLAGCPKDGVILDPFFGAGTTGVVAKKNGRNYIGIELNPKYVEMAQKRIDNTMGTMF